MTNDDKVSKAEFVWLMVQLAEANRAEFRKLREHGWNQAAEAGSAPLKSEQAN